MDRTRLRFSRRELIDLGLAWVVMAVAFAVFLGRPGRLVQDLPFAGRLIVLSALTVGGGFLAHELAHKVVAVRFGQVAEFRADYNMLVIAILSALAGFIIAAPGAVHHRGRITTRQGGLIAAAGPVTNLVLVVVFAPLLVAGGVLFQLGALGVLINAFLAAFNMLPYGPLDGKTVYGWHRGVFAGLLGSGILTTLTAYLVVGIPF